MNNKISKCIKNKLKKKHMSISDFSSLMKVDELLVQDWIDGTKIPNYKQMVKISNILGIEISKLVNIEEINNILEKKNYRLKICNSIIAFLIFLLIICTFKMNKTQKIIEDFNLYTFNAEGENFTLNDSFFIKHNEEKYIEIKGFSLKKDIDIKSLNINISFNDKVWAIKEYDKNNNEEDIDDWLNNIYLKEYGTPEKNQDSFANYDFNSFPGNMKIEINYCLTDNDCAIDVLDIKSIKNKPNNRLE